MDSVGDLELLHTIKLNTHGIVNVAFSKDGSKLGVVFADREYKVWNVATLQEVEFTPVSGAYPQFLFSLSDDRFLIAGWYSMNHAAIWELVSGDLLPNPSGNVFPSNFSISNDGTIIATQSTDSCNIILSDLTTGDTLQVLHGDWCPEDPFEGVDDLPWTVLFSPDDSIFVSVLFDKSIIWDIRTGNRIIEFESDNTLDFSPDGSILAIRRWGKVVLIDTSTWEEIKVIEDSYKYPRPPAIFSHDGDLLMAVVEDNNIRIWDWKAGTQLRTLSTFSGHLLLSPDGTLLVCYDTNKDHIEFWGIP